MRMQTIPDTNLSVYPICLGTMTFGTPVGEADAVKLTQGAIDLGINFIDTANMYEGYTRSIGSPGGVAEEILGKALPGRREKVILATKVGMKIGPTVEDEGLSRAHILREIDRSLRRMQTDYIDLYYMHQPDPETPIAESIQTFDDLVDAGKVRYWGISNFSAVQMSEVLQACDENGWRRPVASQSPYSLLNRGIEEDILPLCEREKMALIPYQVLQGGLLTGKYRRGQELPPGSRKSEQNGWVWELTDDLFDQLEQLEAEAKSNRRTLTQHAILSLLEQPAIVSVILGVKRIDQVEELLTIAE